MKSADYDLTERALTEHRVRGKTLRPPLGMPAEQFTVIRLPVLWEASALAREWMLVLQIDTTASIRSPTGPGFNLKTRSPISN